MCREEGPWRVAPERRQRSSMGMSLLTVWGDGSQQVLFQMPLICCYGSWRPAILKLIVCHWNKVMFLDAQGKIYMLHVQISVGNMSQYAFGCKGFEKFHSKEICRS